MEYMTDQELESFKDYLGRLNPNTLWWLIKSSRYQAIEHYNYGDFQYDETWIYFLPTKFPSEPMNRLNIWKVRHMFPDILLLENWEEWKKEYTARRDAHAIL